MPLQSTSGTASYDAFGGGVAAVPKYIEDYFSTFLYQGTGAAQTITNGIDLSTKGGLVWIKGRSQAWDHGLFDTARGAGYRIISNSTAAENFSLNYVSSFNNNGFSLGSPSSSTNTSGDNYVSWSIAKAPKFFDVVTYTGNGTSGRTISHNLGSVPGFMIVKVTSTADQWCIYHRSQGATKYGLFNTDAFDTYSGTWNNTEPTSTVFTVGNDAFVNANGRTYVAYLFAHDAGGFGLNGTDNVISCGSFTTNGSGVASVTLDYEPQFVLVKRTDSTSDWFMMDNMRGLTADPNNPVAMLRANLSNAENTASYTGWSINATGFGWSAGAASATYIYIAIRRGPMKVPTSGTSVFNTVLWTGNQTNNRQITGVGFNPDFVEAGTRSAATTFSRGVVDRLRGTNPFLVTYETGGENANSDLVSFDNDGITVDYISSGIFNNNSNIYGHFFKRAPSFFDEVCYTGTASVTTVAHNLGAVPELIIVKIRDAGAGWYVYNKDLTSAGYYLLINSTAAQAFSNGLWNSTQPTSSSFTVGTGSGTNGNGSTYVAYLFATCAGVSKVGSYTGTGTTKQVDCGFTGGARFVLIKRTDSTGDWYVWDTARGIVSGNDPYLLLNSTAAETTTTDYIDTYSAGFEISSTAPAAINANGGTFIFLAIA